MMRTTFTSGPFGLRKRFQISILLHWRKKTLAFAPSLQFKNFPGDVSAQVILILQPAEVAGLAAYQGGHKN